MINRTGAPAPFSSPIRQFNVCVANLAPRAGLLISAYPYDQQQTPNGEEETAIDQWR